MDDRGLVETLRSGDSQAPRLLIERYQGVVFGLCFRMRSSNPNALLRPDQHRRAMRGSRFVRLIPHLGCDNLT